MRRSKRKANQNAAAAAIVPAAAPSSDLPNHIICHILSRLPLTSIFTCKRVCKLWRNLIREPYFAKLHLSRSPLSLVFYRRSINNSPAFFEILQLHDPPVLGQHNPTMKFPTKIYFPDMCIDIEASCKGLILLSNNSYDDCLLIVCNPLTAQHFILPKPPKLAPETIHSGVGYVLNRTVGFGFGYSEVTDQYKVLRFTLGFRPVRLLDIDIYTLGIDDEWRSVGNIGQPPATFTTDLVFLNGAFHWTSFQKSWFMCYLDIDKEQFGSFPLPSHIGAACTDLGVVDNQFFVCKDCSFGEQKFWFMKDYGDFGSWTSEIVVEEQFTLGVNRCVRPLTMLKDGTVLMMLINEFTDDTHGKRPEEFLETTLASYNPRTRVLKKINHHDTSLRGVPVAYEPCCFSPMDAFKRHC